MDKAAIAAAVAAEIERQQASAPRCHPACKPGEVRAKGSRIGRSALAEYMPDCSLAGLSLYAQLADAELPCLADRHL
eukprot:scaffold2498_cov114-Isochrysis_galbana.AAC.1